MVKKAIAKAKKMKYHAKSILELDAQKWLIGYELVAALKQEKLIDDEVFLGIPYLLDYKNKHTLLLAVDPCQK